ncbi:hypothetical protein E2C01_010296 [Portunus trituberculatus]|uniref:Uncharacterized protein n=1 Tax=Portunus trituberculatus TaxID=210409 RepID=A0A5B7D801_PORTR|nr:hypothetical protein [Portunus trituberculatus]
MKKRNKTKKNSIFWANLHMWDYHIYIENLSLYISSLSLHTKHSRMNHKPPHLIPLTAHDTASTPHHSHCTHRTQHLRALSGQSPHPG